MRSKQGIHSLLHQAIMERRHFSWTMSNVIYAHTEKRPEGKDTLVKDLGKKSQFSHTLKLARLVHWQLALTGTTCTLTTSANCKLAWVANWQQAPMPKNEKTNNFSQPRPDSPLQEKSKTNPEAKYWPKKKFRTRENPSTYRRWRDYLAIIRARQGMARVMNWKPAPMGATVRVETAPIKPTMKGWKLGKEKVRSDPLGLNQKPNT